MEDRLIIFAVDNSRNNAGLTEMAMFERKRRLVHMVIVEGDTISLAAGSLHFKISTAKSIIQRYRRRGILYVHAGRPGYLSEECFARIRAEIDSGSLLDREDVKTEIMQNSRVTAVERKRMWSE